MVISRLCLRSGLGIDSTGMLRQRRSSSERYDDGSWKDVLRQDRYGDAIQVDADDEDEDDLLIGAEVGA